MSQSYASHITKDNSSEEVGPLLPMPLQPPRPLLMPDKPLPPSPRFAPTLLLHRRNKALKESQIRLKAEVAHLQQLLVHYHEVIKATKELVKGTTLGLKHVEKSTLNMKENETRIQREWDVYLQQQGFDRDAANFF